MQLRKKSEGLACTLYMIWGGGSQAQRVQVIEYKVQVTASLEMDLTLLRMGYQGARNTFCIPLSSNYCKQHSSEREEEEGECGWWKGVVSKLLQRGKS